MAEVTPVAVTVDPATAEGSWTGLLERRRRLDPWLAVSLAWLVLLGLAALLADVLPLANYADPTRTLRVAGYAPPNLLSAHPLGTNNFGLDLLSRSIHAARESLLTAFFAAATGMAVGCLVGIPAGYYGGWLDRVVGIVADAGLAVPALLVLVAAAAVLRPPTTVPEAVLKDGAALALVSAPAMIRLARANALTFAQRDFVLAARALGAGDARIILRELLPNVALPMLSFSFILVAELIVAEGALAYLGLGLQEPQPSWGNMIAEGGLTTLRQHPFVPLVPGAFMFLTVYALNRVGQEARARWSGP